MAEELGGVGPVGAVCVRWLGHAAFELVHGDTCVLVDPFLTGNPVASCSAGDVEPTVVALTHGHVDHVGDTVEIASRTSASVVAVDELSQELRAELAGGHDVRRLNLGGMATFPWGSIQLVPAQHSAHTPKGRPCAAGGLVVEIGGHRIYHLGDTAVTGDLAFPARRAPIDAALVCIGGTFTMDRFDAVHACELVGAARVVPCHYDTLPQIAADAMAFAADVESAGHAEVSVLSPGGAISLGDRGGEG